MKISINEGGHYFTFYFNSNLYGTRSTACRLLRIWWKFNRKPGRGREIMKRWYR